jgi:hypothetical protein
LEARLIERGVTTSSAVRLVRDYSADSIEAKLQVFDQLAGRRDARISKNPAGYLVQSIRKDYVTPVGLQKMSLGSVAKKPDRKPSAQQKTRREIRCPETNEFYVEQGRIQKHLAGLSADELAQLENDALKTSPLFLAKSFQRAVASGSENLIREYRRCLLEHHLQAILSRKDTSASIIT